MPSPNFMEDTLLIGDHLLVDKLAYSPSGLISRHMLPYQPVKRGDIIVFRYPIDIRQTFVKRAMGVPGDRIRIENKQVYINGVKLNEPYKYNKTDYTDSYRDNFPSEPNVHLPPPAEDMQAILHDKIQIAKAVNATVISLDQAPQGYKDFDRGAAKKFVLDPHKMVA